MANTLQIALLRHSKHRGIAARHGRIPTRQYTARVLTSHCAIDPPWLADLEATIDSQRTLEDVVRWGLAHKPPRLVRDVVVQDEFTHDVVVPLRDGFHLVYDTT
jgi:hypothetical protein